VEAMYGNYVEWSAKFHQILNSCAFVHGFEIATNLIFFYAFHVKLIYFGEVMMKVDLFMHVTTGSEIVTMLLLFYSKANEYSGQPIPLFLIWKRERIFIK